MMRFAKIVNESKPLTISSQSAPSQIFDRVLKTPMGIKFGIWWPESFVPVNFWVT